MLQHRFAALTTAHVADARMRVGTEIAHLEACQTDG